MRVRGWPWPSVTTRRNAYSTNAAQKRRESRSCWRSPTLLDLLLICVESRHVDGGGDPEGFRRDRRPTSIELAEELTLLTAELSYLPERRHGLRSCARPSALNHPGIKAVVTAMIQAEALRHACWGAALRVMAKRELATCATVNVRSREEVPQSLPAKLTMPGVILFFLPVLFVVILGPALLRVSDMMAHK